VNRKDANQDEIVGFLRDPWARCNVAITNQVGNGFPDLVVAHPAACSNCGAFAYRNTLVEVKTKTGKLEDTQVEFHAEWRGPIVIVRTIDEAVALVSGRVRGGRAA
jgi:hypothetical protein